MSLLCQVPGCVDRAEFAAREPDDTRVRLCMAHADYARAVNEQVPKNRQVSVKPLGGGT